MNDKNRRRAANQRRRALRSADNGDKTSRPGSNFNKIGRNSSQSAILGHENIHNLLQTPKEMLVLQRTLKGILDWQQHIEHPLVNLDYTWERSRSFVEPLTSMEQCLYVSTENPFSCGKITPQLWRLSSELRSHIGAICTPPTIFLSVDILSSFACKRDANPWYFQSSKFLLNAAAETFPDAHPSLLLLHMLFGNLTASQLVIMYEVGSNVIEQCYGEAAAFFFRVEMHSAASGIGLGATIRSYADALCAATRDAHDPRRLYDIARLYFSMDRYEESADAVRRYLAQFEDEGNGDSSTPIDVLHFLAYVQSKLKDRAGEQTSLQKILDIELARDRRRLHASQISIHALDAISRMDEFYKCHDMYEKRDALHLEFPGTFEH